MQVAQGWLIMNLAGSSPCPDGSCHEVPDQGSRSACGSAQNTCDADVDVTQKAAQANASNVSRSLSIEAAKADSAITRDSLPFVVQAGNILFMVAEESSGWIVAELRFDSAVCAFTEDRRARYQWPREAFGRLLSRVVTGDEIDHDEVYRISDGFSRWLASQFVATQIAE
jgi:hypothetical protein